MSQHPFRHHTEANPPLIGITPATFDRLRRWAVDGVLVGYDQLPTLTVSPDVRARLEANRLDAAESDDALLNRLLDLSALHDQDEGWTLP